MGFGCKYCREAALGRSIGAIAGWYLCLLIRWIRALIGCARQPAQRRALFLLILLITSLLLLAITIPTSWISNAPVMFLLAGFQLVLLRGPLHGLALPLEKAVRIEISICFLAGVAMLLNWRSLWTILEPLGLTRNQAGFYLLLVSVCMWWVWVFWIVFSRQRKLHTIR